MPHSTGTNERVLRPGESLVVDLFPRGPCSSPTARAPSASASRRSRSPAPAPRCAPRWSGPTQRSRPGVRGWELQEDDLRALHAHGYPTPISSPGTTVGYVHNLGHGVGFDLHEQPIFKKVSGAEGVLREGDVFTLEPGLYDPEQGFGVRLEDLVRLDDDGALENLTPLPYELDPRAY